jgi:hypothetical protein
MSPSLRRLRNLCFPVLFFLFSLCPTARSADPTVAGIAPAKNWILPLFTKEGFHSTTLSGDEVHPVSSDRIDVTNVKIFEFSRDAAATPTTILLSPQASYFHKENRATGPSNVRLILLRDNAEITGEDWSYEQTPTGEKISIHRHVRVVFQEKINSMLK